MKISRLWPLLLLCMTMFPAQAETVQSNEVEVELVSSHTAVVPGQDVWLAIRIKPAKDWHTYWKSPGDTGLATTVTWSLPAGFKAESLVWPYPDRHASDGLVSFVYDRDEYLLTRLKVPDSVSEGQVELTAEVEWLACNQICIPGNSELKLPLLVSKQATTSPHFQSLEQARSRVPERLPEGACRAFWKDQKIVLEARLNDFPPGQFDQVLFVSDQDLVIENAAEQIFEPRSNGLRTELLSASVTTEKPKHLSGVLIVHAHQGVHSFYVDVPINDNDIEE